MSINLMDDVSFAFADTINGVASLLDTQIHHTHILNPQTPPKNQPSAPPTPRGPSTPLLIDLSTPRATPTPTAFALPKPSPIRAPPPPSWLNSLPRRSSPLKQAFESNPDAPGEGERGPSPPATVRGADRDAAAGEANKENGRSPTRAVFGGGKKWAVVQDERRKARGGSRSPVKELLAQVGDQSHIGDSSTFSAFGVLDGSEQSLLMNEHGSFFDCPADVTLDSPSGRPAAPPASLAAVGEEDEPQTDDNTSDLLNSLELSRTNLADTMLPISNSVSILPASLTSSTRHARSKSLGAALASPARLTAAALAATEAPAGTSDAGRNLLASSTASFQDYRNSPAKPRVVSIQAERFGGVGAVEGARTPAKRTAFGAGTSKIAESPSNGLESTPETSDSLDLVHRWTNGELAQTDIYDHDPPTTLTQAGATITVEMGLPSPILPLIVSTLVRQPDSPSPPDLLLSDAGAVGSNPTNLSAVHDLPDLSSNDLLAVAAPHGIDLMNWGDESLVVPTPVRRAAGGKLADVDSPDRAGPARVGRVAAVPGRMAASTPSKALSGTERLRLKMAELNRKKGLTTVLARPLPSASVSLLDGTPLAGPSSQPARVTATAPRTPAKEPLRARQSIATPGHIRRQSLAAPPAAAKPRASLMPRSNSERRLSTMAPPVSAAASLAPATPGRSDSTRERLERAKEERRVRELQRSPEKRAETAAAAAQTQARPRIGARTATLGTEAKSTGTGLTRGVFRPSVPAPRTAAASGAVAGSGLTRTSSLSRLPNTSGRPGLARMSSISSVSTLSASANGFRSVATAPSTSARRTASPVKPRPSKGLPMPPRPRPSTVAPAPKKGLSLSGMSMGGSAAAIPRAVGRG